MHSPPVQPAHPLLMALAICAAASCTALPHLDPGTCGNLLVESKEDCDGVAPPGATCGAPGTANACRYLCDLGLATPACPAGWGCGVDGVCREADANHDFQLADVVQVDSRILVPADFDGDHRPALVALSDDDSSGSRFGRILDPDTQPLDTGITIPVAMAQPSVADLDGDGHDDVAFADPTGVVILQGNATHTPAFLACPSILAPGHPHFRGIPLKIDDATPGDQVVVFVDDNQGHVGLYRLGEFTTPMLDLGYTHKTELDLAGILHANLDARPESPCDEIIIAFTGLVSVTEFSPCSGGTWTSSTSARDIPLPQPLASLSAVAEQSVVRAIDVTGDGNVDLLVATQATSADPPAVLLLKGHGDGTFESAAPWAPAWNGGPVSMALPLAAADMDGDGTQDVVFPEGIAVGGPRGLSLAVTSLGVWSEAVVDDFNRDGRREVIAASDTEIGLEVVSRNPTSGRYAQTTIPTPAPARSLTVGDFDGDLLPDVAFASASASKASWLVAYGSRSGPPSAPVTMAWFDAIDQVQAANLADARGQVDAMTDLVVIPELGPGTPGETDSYIASLGRANRTMVAPFVLAENGGAPDVPLSVTSGRFTGAAGPRRIGAVGADAAGTLRLWEFLPGQAGSGQTVIVSGPLPAGPSGFHPTAREVGSVSLRYGAHVAAGDLDGDGTDDVVMSAPYGGGTGIVVAKTTGGTIAVSNPVPVSGTSTLYSLLRLADVDGDGALDILFKPEDDSPADVTILWNDRHGHFAAASVTVLHTSEGIVDFACLRGKAACDLVVIGPTALLDGTPGHAAAVAFVDRQTFRLKPLVSVDASRHVGQLPGGDAVAAGDYDGDGLDDLAIANANGVSIFHANANHP